MTDILSLTGQTTSSPAAVAVTANGTVQIFLTGSVGAGEVRVYIDVGHGPTLYKELTSKSKIAEELYMQIDDELSVQFRNCDSAGILIRQV